MIWLGECSAPLKRWNQCGAQRARPRRRPCVMSEALRAEGLAKTYAEGDLRTHVFHDVSLSVVEGETVAIQRGNAIRY